MILKDKGKLFPLQKNKVVEEDWKVGFYTAQKMKFSITEKILNEKLQFLCSDISLLFDKNIAFTFMQTLF